jgi:hypothetical protein
LNEQDFLKAFHECALDKLTQKDHLFLAWYLLRNHDLELSHEFLSEGLKRFAAFQGASGSYHESITLFWLLLVKHCMEISEKNSDFEEFLNSHSILLDKSLIFKHWRREIILNADARKGWVVPDLLPMP